MSDEPQVIDLSGEGWSLTFDMSAAPEYTVLALYGKATPERTQARLEVLRTHMPRYAMPDGLYCPLIVDQLEQAPPSLDSLKAARGFMEALAPHMSYVVFLVTPERLSSHLMGMNIEMLNRALPNRYAFATTMEEAIAHIRAFHARPAP